MSSFLKDESHPGILQFTPLPTPVIGRSGSPTSGAIWYDSTLNSFQGITNGVIGAIGGGISSSWPVGPQVILAGGPPYNVVPDGQWVTDASTTSGQPIVTCPNSDCNFLNTAKVGQAIYALNVAGGPILGTASANCTVLSIQTANSLTASCNATATVTGTAFLGWGTDWTAKLNQAANDQINAIPCIPRQQLLPGGVILISGPIGNTPAPAGCNPTILNGDGVGFGIEGVGGIMSGPEFLVSPPAITNCTSGALLYNYGAITSLKHLRLFGGEYNNFTAPGCNALINVNNYSYLEDIRIDGIGKTSLLSAIAISNCEQCSLHEVNIQNAGVISCGNSNQQVSFFNVYSSSGLVSGGSGCTINDFMPLYAQANALNGGAGQSGIVDFSRGGAWHPHGGQVGVANGGAVVNLRVGLGAVVVLDNTLIGYSVSGAQYGIFFDTGGATVIAKNGTTIKGGTNGALNNVSNNAGAVFNDDGTTVFSGSIIGNVGYQADGHSIK